MHRRVIVKDADGYIRTEIDLESDDTVHITNTKGDVEDL